MLPVIHRHRSVLFSLSAILGLCALGAPLPAGAGVVAAPTHVRPVQSKADCATALSLLAAICGAAIKEGALQLIWDESSSAVDGFKVYRVDGGGHQLLGTASARYYVVPKRSEGYGNLCFAVEAYAGSETSKDSPHYCYAPGATATTRSFIPSHMVTEVDWKAPSNLVCGLQNLPGSGIFQGADKILGGDFTALFPILSSELKTQGRIKADGLYAGNEWAILGANQYTWKSFFGAVASCTGPTVAVHIKAIAGAAFDVGALTKHKLYSATLTLEASRTVGFPSQKFRLSKGGWCPIYVEVANREWWIAPLGNLTYKAFGRVKVATQPPIPIDVTSLVSSWASGRGTNYGFILASTRLRGTAPRTSNACLMRFEKPSLQIVYF